MPWSLVLLIAFAVLLPVLLVLRFLPAMQVLEARLEGRQAPRWQVHLASVFPLLFTLVFLIGGIAGVILVITWEFSWSILAFSLLFFGWSARHALQLALLYSKRDATLIARLSQQVYAVGYLVAGIMLLIAAISEEPWMALAGLGFLWLGGFLLFAVTKVAKAEDFKRI